MGRSQPTVRNLIENRREGMQQHKRILRAKRQDSYETLWEYAALDAPSIEAAGLADVEWGMLFAICRNHQSRDHVLMLLLWRTVMRLHAIRSLDLEDLVLDAEDLDRLRGVLIPDGIEADVTDEILADPGSRSSERGTARRREPRRRLGVHPTALQRRFVGGSISRFVLDLPLTLPKEPCRVRGILFFVEYRSRNPLSPTSRDPLEALGGKGGGVRATTANTVCQWATRVGRPIRVMGEAAQGN